MDITEALRNEDLSKTDFFDFVSCPEMTDTSRLVRSPSGSGGFMDGLQDLKETNNNHLPAADGFEHLLWSGGGGGSPGDKDAVKLETAILEDWNKLWGHAVVTTAPDPTVGGGVATTGRSSNTDGAIYTLTVLNGEHPTWFTKTDDITPSSISSQQPVDIESLLSIMAPVQPAQPTLNGFRSDTDLGVATSPATTFTFTEENTGDPLLNDTSTDSYQNSLLRSALQGKASFLTRYNIKVEQENVSEDATAATHTELVVPSPVRADDAARDDASPGAAVSQTLFAQTGVLPSMFDTPPTMDSEPSAHSMDELLLSQLDVTYDYEKLRRIEDEVAESVQQYCSSNSNGAIINGVDNSPGASGSPLYKLPVTTASTPTPAPAKSKKYTKRSKSSAEKTSSTTSANGVRKERSLHYCSICSKGFKDKYSVNVHIRTHTGEKPFACTLCGKSFRQKAHLAKHYQTHAQKATLSTSPNHKSTKR